MLFLPDQHLGRNTAVRELGLLARRLRASTTRTSPAAALTAEQLRDAKMILWRGHCSVHGRFTARQRRGRPRRGCPASTCSCTPSAATRSSSAADQVGSTEYIIKTIDAAPAGSAWAVGTELNLVRRLAHAHPDKQIVFLDKTVCYCSTMNRIDLPHLVWALE